MSLAIIHFPLLSLEIYADRKGCIFCGMILKAFYLRTSCELVRGKLERAKN